MDITDEQAANLLGRVMHFIQLIAELAANSTAGEGSPS